MKVHITTRSLICSAVVGLLAISSGGCSSGEGGKQGGEPADAYAVVIHWFVDNAVPAGGETDEKPVVFVEARGEGVSIGLETQVAVVAAADEFADVRFIDDRSEAMDGDGISEGVILIALGPAVVEGDTASVDCDQVFTEELTRSWTFTLAFSNDSWVLTTDPTSQP